MNRNCGNSWLNNRTSCLAECIVVNWLSDGRCIATNRTSRIAANRELAKTHFQGIEIKEPAGKRIAEADDEFNHFDRLNEPDYAWKHAKDSGLGTIRNRSGFGRFRK